MPGFRAPNAYRPYESGYGYLDLQLGKDVHEISFTGSHGQPELLVKKLTLTRAAAIADSLGFPYFQLTNESSSYSIQTQTQTETKTEPEDALNLPHDTTNGIKDLPKNHKTIETQTSTEIRAATVKITVRLSPNACETCIETTKVLAEARSANWIGNSK